jgi:hypothetical protein
MGYLVCANCGKITGEFLQTAYGDYICEDCWDDYICADEGKLEYLIGICNEDYPASDFDAEFLGEVAESWRTHFKMLDLTLAEKFRIEEKARELGIL